MFHTLYPQSCLEPILTAFPSFYHGWDGAIISTPQALCCLKSRANESRAKLA